MAELLQRLRERKMGQWALAYAAGAWLLLQVLGLAADSYEWPRTVMRLAFGVVVVGFAATLVLAWYHGERGEQKVAGAELLILALLLAVGGGVLWRIERAVPAGAAQSPPATEAPVAGTVAAPERTPAAGPQSVAVLPFANLSSDADNAYFATGMQSEILTRLAKVGALRVISQTSTARYASAPENLPEIGRQLGVTHVVEGSVQKIGDSVRINVQLIEAASDAHVWAEIYDRKLVDVLGIQSEVATAIVAALQATLTPAEQVALATTPTANAAAYDAYLRGLAYPTRPMPQVVRARDLFAEAVRLDPGFVEAWTRLAEAQSLLYSNFVDRNPEALAALQRSAETIARLRPDSGEAWLALGYYRYRGLRDYPAAKAAFEQALARMPNNADVHGALAFLERRLGRLPEALQQARLAEQLDPRNPLGPISKGELLSAMRRFPEARAAFDRALELVPGNPDAIASKVVTYHLEGDLDSAQALLAVMPAPGVGDARASEALTSHHVLTRQYDLALRHCTAQLEKTAEARARGAGNLDINYDLRLYACIGFVQRLRGDAAASRAAFRRVLEIAKARADRTNEYAIAGYVAVAHAGLGDAAPAIREAERAVSLNQGDHTNLRSARVRLAQIHASLGNVDEALAIIEALEAEGQGLTPAQLRLHPLWDPLRQDPRFRAMAGQPTP